MKDLVEGGLPISSSEVAVFYDEDEDVVVVQLDYIDLNFHAADFSRLLELLNRASVTLESGVHFDD